MADSYSPALSIATMDTSTLANILGGGDFSDLTLVCQGEEIKVHRAIVCAQSPVLRASMTIGFREARTFVYAIEEFDPKSVRAMVDFMYGKGYSTLSDSKMAADQAHDNSDGHDKDGTLPTHGPDTLVVDWPARVMDHIRVNVIGNYFGLPQLAALAKDELSRELEEWTKAQVATNNATAASPDASPSNTENVSNTYNDHDNSSIASELPKIIKLAQKLAGDKTVLDILAVAAKANLDSMLGSPAFDELKSMPEFLIMVLGHCNEDEKSLRQSSADAKAKWDSKLGRIDREVTKIIQCVVCLNKTHKCRHCSAQFKSEIDLFETVVRCKSCRCRHPASSPHELSNVCSDLWGAYRLALE